VEQIYLEWFRQYVFTVVFYAIRLQPLGNGVVPVREVYVSWAAEKYSFAKRIRPPGPQQHIAAKLKLWHLSLVKITLFHRKTQHCNTVNSGNFQIK